MSEKTLIADSIILVIVAIMLFFMTIISYKALKITQFQDKILILMLFFLDLTLIGHIIFYTLRVIIYAYELENPDATEPLFGQCFSSFVSVLPVLLFSIAVLFNINKWVYFLLRIQETINQDSDEFKRNMKILKAIIGFMIFTIVIIHVTLFSLFCTEEDDRFINKLGLTIGVIYLILGVIFFISGVLLLRKLKIYYRTFYQNVRFTLWISASLLSATLLVRGILNVLRFADYIELDEELQESDQQNTYFEPLYETFMFVFADMIPICSQLLSMVFGLIRNNSSKQNYKKNINNSGDGTDDNTNHDHLNPNNNMLNLEAYGQAGGGSNYNQNNKLRKNDDDYDNDSFLSLTSVLSFFDPPVLEYNKGNYISNYAKNQGTMALGGGAALRMNREASNSKYESQISNNLGQNVTAYNDTRGGGATSYEKQKTQKRKESIFRLFKKNTIESDGNLETQ